MSLFGFFQIRCGWLPVAQMFQDLLQAGDVMPNLLGMVSGHTYYYFTEVAPMLLLPRRVGPPSVDGTHPGRRTRVRDANA